MKEFLPIRRALEEQAAQETNKPRNFLRLAELNYIASLNLVNPFKSMDLINARERS
jgi:hypothetical protein